MKYDVQTAEAMHDAGRYIYVLFMCQQALEKCLKAVVLHRGGEILPIHNLRRLAEQSGVRFDEQQFRKLDFLSQYYINARYKEDLEELSRGITEEVSGDFLKFSREGITWITREIEPSTK